MPVTLDAAVAEIRAAERHIRDRFTIGRTEPYEMHRFWMHIADWMNATAADSGHALLPPERRNFNRCVEAATAYLDSVPLPDSQIECPNCKARGHAGSLLSEGYSGRHIRRSYSGLARCSGLGNMGGCGFEVHWEAPE